MITDKDRLIEERILSKLHREMGDKTAEALLDDQVIEIILNPDGKLWVERLEEPMLLMGEMSRQQAMGLLTTIASYHSTTITRENPILECELPHYGCRFEGLISPVVANPAFSIRKKAVKVFTLQEYVSSGVMSEAQCDVIKDAVSARCNILVVGGTGSGKTTLTNALIHYIAEVNPEHRLVIIEDTNEIQCQSDNAAILRATEHVSMLRLLKATMRLRPDRILVGEVRGEEALSLLKAWNTGHPGGVSTLHANSSLEGLTRLESLISESNVPPQPKLIADAVDVVIHIGKQQLDGGRVGRRVQSVLKVSGYSGDEYETEILI